MAGLCTTNENDK